uniref:Uncharacterized protein n=1 Tax=Geobacter sp. (strain M21) TaxID=443144 RepID=C6E6S9_GEOSM
MLEPMTAYEAGLMNEIRLLREENLDLKIKALELAKEINSLRSLAAQVQNLTARIAA